MAIPRADHQTTATAAKPKPKAKAKRPGRQEDHARQDDRVGQAGRPDHPVAARPERG